LIDGNRVHRAMTSGSALGFEGLRKIRQRGKDSERFERSSVDIKTSNRNGN
jgi:hypothetical protein